MWVSFIYIYKIDTYIQKSNNMKDSYIQPSCNKAFPLH